MRERVDHLFSYALEGVKAEDLIDTIPMAEGKRELRLYRRRYEKAL